MLLVLGTRLSNVSVLQATEQLSPALRSFLVQLTFNFSWVFRFFSLKRAVFLCAGGPESS